MQWISHVPPFKLRSLYYNGSLLSKKHLCAKILLAAFDLCYMTFQWPLRFSAWNLTIIATGKYYWRVDKTSIKIYSFMTLRMCSAVRTPIYLVSIGLIFCAAWSICTSLHLLSRKIPAVQIQIISSVRKSFWNTSMVLECLMDVIKVFWRKLVWIKVSKAVVQSTTALLHVWDC